MVENTKDNKCSSKWDFGRESTIHGLLVGHKLFEESLGDK